MLFKKGIPRLSVQAFGAILSETEKMLRFTKVLTIDLHL